LPRESASNYSCLRSLEFEIIAVKALRTTSKPVALRAPSVKSQGFKTFMLCCNVKLQAGTKRITETKNIVAASETLL
jgi:hypothetical protein